MKKFKDVEILTDNVYLNVENGSLVKTITMTTKEAQNIYGDLDVVMVSEPRHEGEGDYRKEGITDVILKEK